MLDLLKILQYLYRMKWLLISWTVNALGFLQAFSVVVIHVPQETNEVKRSRIQLMDDRNPCRNTAKVTKSSVARGRLWRCWLLGAGAAAGAWGMPSILGKWFSRRKEKTGWFVCLGGGDKKYQKPWKEMWEPSGKGKSVTKGLAPTCKRYSRSRKWTRGKL